VNEDWTGSRDSRGSTGFGKQEFHLSAGESPWRPVDPPHPVILSKKAIGSVMVQIPARLSAAGRFAMICE
jgi:hypothetical protein